MSISAEQSRERVKTLNPPSHIVIINYLGLSLTANLSSLSSNKCPLIAEQGPNDGLTPLANIIAPSSLTLVATGSDHYFAEDPDINLKTIAMVKTVLNLVQRRAPVEYNAKRLDMTYPSSYCLPLAPICFSACRRCSTVISTEKQIC